MSRGNEALDFGVTPVEPGNLSLRTYQAMREALIAGRFSSGQRLVMQDLAAAFGTSVTPVREACLRLVTERGLELRSGRFVAVPELTRARYLEIRAIRMALEGLAAELACQHVRPADIDALERTHRRFETAERSRRREAAIVANRDFHFAIYRLSGMDMLISHIESLWISMGPILNVYYAEVATNYVGAEEHLVLIDALRRGDGQAAREALVRDILRGGASIMAHLDAEEAEPF